MNAAEQGHLLLKQGKAKEAEVEFRRVLEGEPDHVEALNVVGLAALVVFVLCFIPVPLRLKP